LIAGYWNMNCMAEVNENPNQAHKHCPNQTNNK
jgi:hypothetical protein